MTDTAKEETALLNHDDSSRWTEQAITKKSDSKKKCWIALVAAILLLGTVGVIVAIIVSNINDDEPDVEPPNDYTREFEFSATIRFNDDVEFTTSSAGVSEPISCKTMTETVNEELTEWTSIKISDVAMSASSVDLLMNCLATSDYIAPDGYDWIKFMNWISLDGLLDIDTL